MQAQKGERVRYDCFMFFNELELLQIRLAELSSVVDLFVIIEAPWTFQGRPKPLLFDENRARFRPYLSRIRHIVADPPPKITDQWSREFHQRNCLRQGLADAAADDFVMISDVDEIIRAESVVAAARRGVFTLFQMALFRYYMNWREGPWLKAYGGPASYIRQMPDLSEPRLTEAGYLQRFAETGESQIVENAGWHFSWLGGEERMRTKLRAFSHTEPEVSRWADADLGREVHLRRNFVDKAPLTQVDLVELPKSVQGAANEYLRMGFLAP
jgi:hypothetical protein